jgi:hypothetical protein
MVNQSIRAGLRVADKLYTEQGCLVGGDFHLFSVLVLLYSNAIDDFDNALNVVLIS